VGPARAKKILTAFGSITALRSAAAEAVAERAGIPYEVAVKVKEAFEGKA